MVVGALYDFNIFLYISESGRIFESTGWAGDTVWEAWDNIINEKGMLPWDKVKGSSMYQEMKEVEVGLEDPIAPKEVIESMEVDYELADIPKHRVFCHKYTKRRFKNTKLDEKYIKRRKLRRNK